MSMEEEQINFQYDSYSLQNPIYSEQSSQLNDKFKQNIQNFQFDQYSEEVQKNQNRNENRTRVFQNLQLLIRSKNLHNISDELIKKFTTRNGQFYQRFNDLFIGIGYNEEEIFINTIVDFYEKMQSYFSGKRLIDNTRDDFELVLCVYYYQVSRLIIDFESNIKIWTTFKKFIQLNHNFDSNTQKHFKDFFDSIGLLLDKTGIKDKLPEEESVYFTKFQRYFEDFTNRVNIKQKIEQRTTDINRIKTLEISQKQNNDNISQDKQNNIKRFNMLSDRVALISTKLNIPKNLSLNDFLEQEKPKFQLNTLNNIGFYDGWMKAMLGFFNTNIYNFTTIDYPNHDQFNQFRETFFYLEFEKIKSELNILSANFVQEINNYGQNHKENNKDQINQQEYDKEKKKKTDLYLSRAKQLISNILIRQYEEYIKDQSLNLKNRSINGNEELALYKKCYVNYFAFKAYADKLNFSDFEKIYTELDEIKKTQDVDLYNIERALGIVAVDIEEQIKEYFLYDEIKKISNSINEILHFDKFTTYESLIDDLFFGVSSYNKLSTFISQDFFNQNRSIANDIIQKRGEIIGKISTITEKEKKKSRRQEIKDILNPEESEEKKKVEKKKVEKTIIQNFEDVKSLITKNIAVIIQNYDNLINKMGDAINKLDDKNLKQQLLNKLNEKKSEINSTYSSKTMKMILDNDSQQLTKGLDLLGMRIKKTDKNNEELLKIIKDLEEKKVDKTITDISNKNEKMLYHNKEFNEIIEHAKTTLPQLKDKLIKHNNLKNSFIIAVKKHLNITNDISDESLKEKLETLNIRLNGISAIKKLEEINKNILSTENVISKINNDISKEMSNMSNMPLETLSFLTSNILKDANPESFINLQLLATSLRPKILDENTITDIHNRLLTKIGFVPKKVGDTPFGVIKTLEDEQARIAKIVHEMTADKQKRKEEKKTFIERINEQMSKFEKELNSIYEWVSTPQLEKMIDDDEEFSKKSDSEKEEIGKQIEKQEKESFELSNPPPKIKYERAYKKWKSSEPELVKMRSKYVSEQLAELKIFLEKVQAIDFNIRSVFDKTMNDYRGEFNTKFSDIETKIKENKEKLESEVKRIDEELTSIKNDIFIDVEHKKTLKSKVDKDIKTVNAKLKVLTTKQEDIEKKFTKEFEPIAKELKESKDKIKEKEIEVELLKKKEKKQIEESEENLKRIENDNERKLKEQEIKLSDEKKIREKKEIEIEEKDKEIKRLEDLKEKNIQIQRAKEEIIVKQKEIEQSRLFEKNLLEKLAEERKKNNELLISQKEIDLNTITSEFEKEKLSALERISELRKKEQELIKQIEEEKTKREKEIKDLQEKVLKSENKYLSEQILKLEEKNKLLEEKKDVETKINEKTIEQTNLKNSQEKIEKDLKELEQRIQEIEKQKTQINEIKVEVQRVKEVKEGFLLKQSEKLKFVEAKLTRLRKKFEEEKKKVEEISKEQKIQKEELIELKKEVAAIKKFAADSSGRSLEDTTFKDVYNQLKFNTHDDIVGKPPPWEGSKSPITRFSDNNMRQGHNNHIQQVKLTLKIEENEAKSNIFFYTKFGTDKDVRLHLFGLDENRVPKAGEEESLRVRNLYKFKEQIVIANFQNNINEMFQKLEKFTNLETLIVPFGVKPLKLFDKNDAKEFINFIYRKSLNLVVFSMDLFFNDLSFIKCNDSSNYNEKQKLITQLVIKFKTEKEFENILYTFVATSESNSYSKKILASSDIYLCTDDEKIDKNKLKDIKDRKGFQWKAIKIHVWINDDKIFS